MLVPRSNPAANRRGLTFWAQWLCGIALVSALLCQLAIQHYGEGPRDYRVLIVLTLFCSIPVYVLLRVHHKRYNLATGLLRLLTGWVCLLAVLAAIVHVSRSHESYSMDIIINWALLGYLLQVAAYVPLRHFANLHARKLRDTRSAVIVGNGPLTHQLAEALCERVALVGLVSAGGELGEGDGRFAVLGDIAQLREIITEQRIHRVYLSLSLEESAHIEELYFDLLELSVDVVWIPDFGKMLLLNQSVAQIEQLPAIYLNETPISSHPAGVFSKELLDRSLALLAIVVLSPLLLAVAIAVKLSSPGPVLFRQPRHGWNGEVIEVWKFRSMRLHDDRAVKQATRDDPRITPVGRFIRRTSIDELPQLFNVLRGEMSLVGPRPHAITHNHYYSDKIRAYMARHRIKPGITGLAQVSGHRGETETIEKMQQRVEQDLAYINHWSLWLDIKILLKTPFTLFSKDIY